MIAWLIRLFGHLSVDVSALRRRRFDAPVLAVMISARQQIAIVTAAIAGIAEGRETATTETIIRSSDQPAQPAGGSSTSMDQVSRSLPPELEEEQPEGQRVISKPFELAIRNLVACDRLREACDCGTVLEAGRRVGEAAGVAAGAPLVMLTLGEGGGFMLCGTVSLVCSEEGTVRWACPKCRPYVVVNQGRVACARCGITAPDYLADDGELP